MSDNYYGKQSFNNINPLTGLPYTPEELGQSPYAPADSFGLPPYANPVSMGQPSAFQYAPPGKNMPPLQGQTSYSPPYQDFDYSRNAYPQTSPYPPISGAEQPYMPSAPTYPPMSSAEQPYMPSASTYPPMSGAEQPYMPSASPYQQQPSMPYQQPSPLQDFDAYMQSLQPNNSQNQYQSSPAPYQPTFAPPVFGNQGYQSSDYYQSGPQFAPIAAQPQQTSATFPQYPQSTAARPEPACPTASSDDLDKSGGFTVTGLFPLVDAIGSSPAAQAPYAQQNNAGGDVFAIADNLERALKAKDASEVFTENNLLSEGAEVLVEAKLLTSDYFVKDGTNEPHLMFDKFSLSLKSGTCAIVVADHGISSYSLLRAIANDCEMEFGEINSDHGSYNPSDFIYIGGDGALINNASCFEYIMLAVSKKKVHRKEKAAKISAFFDDLGITDMLELQIGELSYSRRMMLLLIAASLSDTHCIVLNDPRYTPQPEDEMPLRRIFRAIYDSGKAVLLTCAKPKNLAFAANRVVALKRGVKVFDDSISAFVEKCCTDLLTFSCDNSASVLERLKELFPQIKSNQEGQIVELWKKPGISIDVRKLADELSALGIDQNMIHLSDRSFEIACREVLKKS
ncbi:MAG: hypothetical protein RSE36_04445 [Oscillospiraceae bacterium]